MRILLVLLAVAISGCAHNRENGLIQRHGAACEQLGYVPASGDWIACTQQVERIRLAYKRQDFQVPTAKNQNVKMTCSFSRTTTCK